MRPLFHKKGDCICALTAKVKVCLNGSAALFSTNLFIKTATNFSAATAISSISSSWAVMLAMPRPDAKVTDSISSSNCYISGAYFRLNDPDSPAFLFLTVLRYL